MKQRSLVWLCLVLAVPGLEAEDSHVLTLEDCEARFMEEPEARESAECFLAVMDLDPDLTDQVAARLEDLWEEYQEIPWLPYCLAGALWGRSDSVPDLYSAAAEIAHRRGMAIAEFSALRGQARCLTKDGRFAEAKEALGRLSQLAATTGGPEFRAMLHIESAYFALETKGDCDAAYQRLLEDEELALSGAFPGLKKAWLEYAQALANNLGDYSQAQEYQRWLDVTLMDRGDLAAIARMQYREMWRRAAVGASGGYTPADIQEMAARTLASARQARIPDIEAAAHRILARFLEGEDVETHLEACIEVGANDRQHVLCLEELAVHRAATDPVAAHQALAEARKVASKLPEGSGWSPLYSSLAESRVHWMLGNREAATKAGLAVLDEVEAHRALQGSESGRIGVMEAWWRPYLELVGRLLADGGALDRVAVESAFQVAERMRSRVLCESLLAYGQPLAAEETLQTIPSLGEIEESLQEDEALLSFLFAGDVDLYGRFAGGSWLMVSTRGGTRVHRISDPTGIETMAQIVGASEDPEDKPEFLVRLHRQLLHEALADLPETIKSLILIPDGELHRLPFALLRSAQGRRLNEHYRYTVAPSATLWWYWRSNPVQHPLTGGRDVPALVFSDPRHPAGKPLVNLQNEPLDRLPGARDEGRWIVRRLGGGSQLQEAVDASESALRSHIGLRRFRVLHLGVHSDPGENGVIYLAPSATESGDGADDGRHDGLLTPEEIINLDLQDQLVVLAACESASGRVARGEGVMGLGRTFFQAGARTVVATQLEVPDRQMYLFSRAFYQHLATGMSVADAFSSAQLDRRRAGTSVAVLGRLVVLGDGDLRPFPEGIPAPQASTDGFLRIGGSAVLALVLGWFVVRRLLGLPGL